MLFYALLAAIFAALQFLLTDRLTMHGLVIGGVFGILGHWRATWVSSVLIESNSISRTDLMRRLEEIGYRMDREPGEMIPDLPRWSRFDSQNVLLDSIDGAVNVTGPYYILKRLVKDVAPAPRG
jgi:hypothetical protein